ncbi:hypothetical protein Gxy13693_032_047 [Komagataeibacter xylinus NBRC 13693]|uniref:Uncharacterized protein n=1 Tax=Komagataeibacter xylinus NBRC 13693 TaxID=1234668 RepID=A0A0D6Q8E0_KOMXY|nr:hypothetical protein Gxy13693_032_047 [Komagataeibacter xylinus NBRC 13693]
MVQKRKRPTAIGVGIFRFPISPATTIKATRPVAPSCLRMQIRKGGRIWPACAKCNLRAISAPAGAMAAIHPRIIMGAGAWLWHSGDHGGPSFPLRTPTACPRARCRQAA